MLRERERASLPHPATPYLVLEHKECDARTFITPGYSEAHEKEDERGDAELLNDLQRFGLAFRWQDTPYNEPGAGERLF